MNAAIGRIIAKKFCIIESQDSICRTQMGIERVNGTFVNGLLTGSATLYFEKQSILRAQFKKGVISGLSRLFTCQYGVCDFTVEAWNQLNWLSQARIVRIDKRVGFYSSMCLN